MKKNLNILESFTDSATITVLFITGATIYSELSKPFNNFLKDTFMHHWIGKSVLSLALFITLGFLFLRLSPKSSEAGLVKKLRLLTLVTIFGFFAILGFFIYEGLLA